jgi:hypothetical protein
MAHAGRFLSEISGFAPDDGVVTTPRFSGEFSTLAWGRIMGNQRWEGRLELWRGLRKRRRLERSGRSSVTRNGRKSRHGCRRMPHRLLVTLVIAIAYAGRRRALCHWQAPSAAKSPCHSGHSRESTVP